MEIKEEDEEELEEVAQRIFPSAAEIFQGEKTRNKKKHQQILATCHVLIAFLFLAGVLGEVLIILCLSEDLQEAYRFGSGFELMTLSFKTLSKAFW